VQEKLIYNKLDYWYTQLYDWISADIDEKPRIIEKICSNCKMHLESIASLVGGEFEENDVKDKVVYIRFSDLNYVLRVEDKETNKYHEISCVSKIRINPCIKSPLFEEHIDYVGDLSHMPRGALKEIFSKYNINILDTYTMHRVDELGRNIWYIETADGSYTIKKFRDVIEVYSNETYPYRSKILIISTANYDFTEGLKESFFSSIGEISETLCNCISGLYLNDIEGGAKKTEEPNEHKSIHRVIIKSVATNDTRLRELFVNRDGLNDLLKKLKNNDYLDLLIGGIISSLCGEIIRDWRNKLTDKAESCLRKAIWRLVESDKAEGIYVTSTNKWTTITSVAFYYKDNDQESVHKILRSWATDLNSRL
jgi:hypothetical protein